MKLFNILISLILFSSCASKYYPVYEKPPMNDHESSLKGISLKYQQAKLNNKGGYANKAKKKGLHFIHIRLTNSNDTSIQINKESFSFFVDYSQAKLLNPDEVKKLIKQRPGYYLFWLLTIPNAIGYNGGITVHPLWIWGGAAGGTFGIYNYWVARKANINFYKDFMSQSILNQKVSTGETVEGWICIEHEGKVEKLMLKYNED